MIKILMKYFWNKGNAKQGNFTRVGTPIRVMTKTKDGWRFSAGQISKVQGSEIDVWVFPCTGENPFNLKKVSHLDFMKKGLPWWDYVAKDYCINEEI